MIIKYHFSYLKTRNYTKFNARTTRNFSAGLHQKLITLYRSERLRNVIRQIEKVCHHKDTSGPVESDPQYMILVDANNLVVEIDTEICTSVVIYGNPNTRKRSPQNNILLERNWSIELHSLPSLHLDKRE